MTTEKEDTDPSTPESRRPSSPRRGYGLREVGAREPAPEDPNRPITDPGLGPGPPLAPTPKPPSARSRGVVVPAPTSLGPNAVTPAAGLRVAPGRPASAALSSVLPLAKNSKDSVELLLDGMTGPRPDRRKTTPQSDGEASASYHARHGVHPSHALGEPGPKVVVERAAEPSSPLATADTVPTPPPPAASAAETTVVPPRALGRRIAMAVLAALLIVLAAFIAMDVGSPRAQGTAPAPAQAQAAPPATAKLSAAAPSPATSHSTEPTVASSNATASGAGPGTAPAEAEVAKPAVTVQGERPKRRRQSSGDNDDVGEFKTSF